MDHHHHEDGKVSIDERESDEESLMELRRGPWTVDEDFTLINYIAHHGEGRWNSLARCAGLKRTGKSCRLRWLNYLRPDVRRGNITLEEQLLILELHSRWGNRWSKIAQHLPGRTDNEIKNYWRTRVQKHAKQLKCDVNSKQFKDTMRYLWMPRLVERIQAAATTTATGCGGGAPVVASSATTSSFHHQLASLNSPNLEMGSAQITLPHSGPAHTYTPENSASSESFGTPASDYYAAPNVNNQFSYGDQNLTSPSGFYNQGLGLNGEWMDGGDASGNLWDVDDMWFLQQQFNSNA